MTAFNERALKTQEDIVKFPVHTGAVLQAGHSTTYNPTTVDAACTGLGRNPKLIWAIRLEAEISTKAVMLIRILVALRLWLQVVDWSGVWRLAM
jgi:hypothetical protein